MIIISCCHLCTVLLLKLHSTCFLNAPLQTSVSDLTSFQCHIAADSISSILCFLQISWSTQAKTIQTSLLGVMEAIWTTRNDICLDNHTLSYDRSKNMIYVEVNRTGNCCLESNSISSFFLKVFSRYIYIYILGRSHPMFLFFTFSSLVLIGY